jgi:CRP-like cAMP-binding protein
VETPETLRRRLASSPLCRGLKEKELDELVAISENQTVPSGGYVFKQGDLADAVLFITQGRVEISKDGQRLAGLSTGDVLGELSVFGGSHRRSASALATSDVNVLKVPTRTFRNLIEDGNVAVLKIVANLAQQMAERLVLLNEKLLATTKKVDIDARTGLSGWKI